MNTYLMQYVTSAYAKVVDITDFPDLGGSPEQIDVTTLSDTSRHYIAGVRSGDALEFTANYTSADFATIAAITGTKQFAVYFGASNLGVPDGSKGKFFFSGTIAARVNGGAVNEAVTMTITIYPTTDITTVEPSHT